MTFGPCGGVAPDLSCEVDDRRCSFIDQPSPVWVGTTQVPRQLGMAPVIVDLRPDLSQSDFADATDLLVAAGVTGLIGDHLDEPPGRNTADQVRALTARGLSVVATVACRGKTPALAAAKVRDLVRAGATAVLCVTGDHPAARGLDVRGADFELDSLGLVAMARGIAPGVVVAESPMSPPTDLRPDRLAVKQHAGADIAILNHSGPVAALHEFADRAKAAGVTMSMAAPVPVVTSAATLTALTQFPGVHLPPEIYEAARSAEPRRAGIAASVAIGRRLLNGGRFDHLNLSGRATNGGQYERCRIMADIATALLSPDEQGY